MVRARGAGLRRRHPRKGHWVNIYGIDFETYWDADYSLSKMNPIAYVMDARFEVISVSIKINGDPPAVYFGDEVEPALRAIDWSRAAALGHNLSGFEALILAFKYGIRPRLWLCTLAMARPIYAKTVGLSLAALAEHLDVGFKDSAALHATKGKRLKDFTPGEITAMRIYNGGDCDLCWGVFLHLRPQYSVEELWHIDCNIRMLVEPVFELDAPLLEAALSVERSNKHKALLELAKLTHVVHGEGWGCEQLMVDKTRQQMNSSAKFAEVLKARGVDVPLKRSKTDPRKKIPAIAKTDEAIVVCDSSGAVHQTPWECACSRAAEREVHPARNAHRVVPGHQRRAAQAARADALLRR
jgi:hypothetical protein